MKVISDLFRILKAPLKSVRWSWGSVRPDGTVVLRVSQDGWTSKGICIMAPDWKPGTNGYNERLEHIELIKAGAPVYAIMCEMLPPAPDGGERIKAFGDRDVWSCIKWHEDDSFYIVPDARVPVYQIVKADMLEDMEGSEPDDSPDHDSDDLDYLT
jgi:hypothetical protein